MPGEAGALRDSFLVEGTTVLIKNPTESLSLVLSPVLF